MKLIGFAMVKNEEDIIEQFVRHNLQYLDEIHICDHSSKDFTPHILLSLKAEGLPIHLFTSSTLGHPQSQTMTMMLQSALGSIGPGVYFPLDADEFIHPHCGQRAGLEKDLSALPRNSCFRVPWRNMVVTEGLGEEHFRDVPKTLNQLEVLDDPSAATQKVIFKIDDVEQGRKVVVGQGNHGFAGGVVLELVEYGALDYIHTPVRSATQIFRKFVGGWLANVQSFGMDTPIAAHWREIFEKICNGRAATNQDIAFAMSLYLAAPREASHAGTLKFENVRGEDLFHYELRYAHLRRPGMGMVLKDLEEALGKMHGQINGLQQQLTALQPVPAPHLPA